MGSTQDRVRLTKRCLAANRRISVLAVCIPLAIASPALAKDTAEPEFAAPQLSAQTGEQFARVRAEPRRHRQFQNLRAFDSTAAPAPVPARITVGTPAASAQIMVGDGPAMAQVTIGGAVGMGQISVSRAGDALGAPVDFARFMLRPALGGQLPSGLPLASARLTSGFGMRGHPILGGYRAHSGIDLAAPFGSPIYATSDATVSSARWQGGYGLLVALDHGAGLQTRYGHMSRLNVAAGQRVRKGDVIGYVGSTGRSTRPHVHYEMRVNGQAVNPFAAKVR